MLMKTKFLLLVIAILLACSYAMAQTGPGGIGGDEDAYEEGEPMISLWLRAHDLVEEDGFEDGEEVDEWTDYVSGLDFVAEAPDDGVHGMPILELDKINGYPWLKFNGNEFLVIPDHEHLDGGMGLGLFYVTNYASGKAGTLTQKLVHWNVFGEHSDLGRVMTMADIKFSWDSHVSAKGDWTFFINGNLPDGSGQDVFTDTLYKGGVNYLVDYVFNKNWGGTIRVNGDVSTNPNRSEGNPNPITLGECVIGGDPMDPACTDYGTADVHIGVQYWDPPGWNTGGVSNYDSYLNGGVAEIIIYKGELDSTDMLIVENYLSTKYNLPLDPAFKRYLDTTFTHDLIGIGTEQGNNVHPSSIAKEFSLDALNESLDAPQEYLFAASNGIIEIEYTDDNTGEGVSRWNKIWNLEKTGTIDAKLAFNFSEAGVTALLATDYVLLYRADSESDFTALTVTGELKYKVLSFELDDADLQSGQYTIGELSGENAIRIRDYSETMNLFPNPAGEIVKININNDLIGDMSGRILDYTGREISTFVLHKSSRNYQQTLDVNFLDTGIYFLEVSQGSARIVKSFCKF